MKDRSVRKKSIAALIEVMNDILFEKHGDKKEDKKPQDEEEKEEVAPASEAPKK